MRHFIVHSRKCFLKGLNPHQNRTVPPLRYEWVYGLKKDFPHLEFSLNGGMHSCHEAGAVIAYTPDWQQSEAAPLAEAPINGFMPHDEPAVASTVAVAEASAANGGDAPMDSVPEASTSSQHASSAPHSGRTPRLHGVMIGRAAYNDPWGCLGDADRAIFGAATNPATCRRQVGV